ncbi:MAG: 2-amino-4-hydroxy-6-hydroxymethyldihydropteridine diphosphokinase [Gammaproteobacteria bacterium]|nr:2-amino-4-hydroxy-6-hydroxymethyldihydropteridine diphosphokinase [Gammaproteobacteria bacterium]NIO61690.1 2-amino-4-hydroxy-6-hydroxymethyldihydropteridine diphosphokinase [Gammaproteobacteria bacterium]NIP49310.1 2-amino-4-hydroxy-6-hydroxymethyldihydropteridine diphosphokinase [Gammaproteobacteria bacterium]NIQ10532.1 2-amino-4-hydroxy-6-hydroxymethyldihydropteridine diphosphokinase [Gammaproteobacteria bacterium]NIQ18941.1 2-amino-4-hydroxy-6-hydroxymethyldihydropteridine diphosphokinas
MTQVYVGIGSNINREESIRGGLEALSKKFGELTLSDIYESEAYGFDGDNFYNLVAGFQTDLPVNGLNAALKGIEIDLGREQHGKKFLPRTLDIDLLLYGNLVQHDKNVDVPREDIEQYAFVLKPLADIAGDFRHPETNKTFAEMWSAFDKQDQAIWPASMSVE